MRKQKPSNATMFILFDCYVFHLFWKAIIR